MTDADMVEIQLRKWIGRGHVHNVTLRPTYSNPSIPAGETVVAEVTDRAGRGVFFTSSGFTLPDVALSAITMIIQPHGFRRGQTGSHTSRRITIISSCPFATAHLLRLQTLSRLRFHCSGSLSGCWRGDEMQGNNFSRTR